MGEKVAKVGIKKEPGYLYYIDKDGDVARAKMVHGDKKEEKVESGEKQDEIKQ